jgi:DHA1 family tetracycline resistance protein-like MFS transporter
MSQEQESAGNGRRRAAAAFIFVTVALDIIAGGVVGPVWPQLIQGFLGGDTSRSAVVFGVFATLFAVMQLLCMPVLGSLSDRFGRRPVILISCFGLAIDYVIMATAPNLAWLFVGRILSGGASASMATAGAYIADVTPPEKRAGAFGMLSAAFGLGFIVGPMMGGLLGQLSPRLPFWAAAGLTFANAAYGVLVLPESLRREHRAAFSFKLANPVAALGVLGANPRLARLAAINFMARLVHAVFAVAWTLYAAARYGWGPAMIGVSLVVVGASSLVVSMLLVRPTVAWLGERSAMIAGLLFGALGFGLLGWAPQGWTFLVSIAVLCLWGLASPCIQSLMTRLVAPSEQGRLQGANAGVTSIAGIVGPPIFAAALAFGSTPAHAALGLIGLPFYLAAALMLVAVGVAWRATASDVAPRQAI